MDSEVRFPWVDSGAAQARGVVQKTLEHWKEDSDLAGVRDPALLEKLPKAEQAEWSQLWADVEALRKKAAEAGKKQP
jgi:serine/threonine-protein kinase